MHSQNHYLAGIARTSLQKFADWLTQPSCVEISLADYRDQDSARDYFIYLLGESISVMPNNTQSEIAFQLHFSQLFQEYNGFSSCNVVIHVGNRQKNVWASNKGNQIRYTVDTYKKLSV